MEFKQTSFSCCSSSEKLDFFSKIILLYFFTSSHWENKQNTQNKLPQPQTRSSKQASRMCHPESLYWRIATAWRHFSYATLCVHTCVCNSFLSSSVVLCFWHVACVRGIESDTRDKAPSLRGLLLISETMLVLKCCKCS